LQNKRRKKSSDTDNVYIQSVAKGLAVLCPKIIIIGERITELVLKSGAFFY